MMECQVPPPALRIGSGRSVPLSSFEKRDFAANRWWAHVDSNHGPLPTANGRRPESVKLLGWTEATAREVFLPRHEEAFDLRAEEAVAESPLHRPQVTL